MVKLDIELTDEEFCELAKAMIMHLTSIKTLIPDVPQSRVNVLESLTKKFKDYFDENGNSR